MPIELKKRISDQLQEARMTTPAHLPKAYEEVIDFIAAGTDPAALIAFQPSETTKNRVGELLYKEKTADLSPEEKNELDHYLQLEHLMRLAKARARHYLPHE
jgi:hypothetical protein